MFVAYVVNLKLKKPTPKSRLPLVVQARELPELSHLRH